jgi:hypothetical protein
MLRTDEALQVRALGRSQDSQARREKLRAPRLMTGESVKREPSLKFERTVEEKRARRERSGSRLEEARAVSHVEPNSHCPGSWRLTPELSRAAKRLRLE